METGYQMQNNLSDSPATRLTADVLERGATFIPLVPGGKKPDLPEGLWGKGKLQRVTETQRAALLPSPPQNRGILTGHDRVRLPDGSWTGVCVVDVDDKPAKGARAAKAGSKNLEALEAKYGPLPPTLTARSASGGRHLYFVMPAEFTSVSNRVLGQDIDFQNEGQQVVFPGSEISGEVAAREPNYVAGRYEWLDASVPVANLPYAWIVALSAKAKPDESPCAVDEVPIADVSSAYGKWRTEKAVNYLERNADLSIEGSGGRNVMFGVGVTLMRKFRLPLGIAIDLVERHYNPRLTAAKTTAWDREGIIERLTSAVNTSSAAPESQPTEEEWPAHMARLNSFGEALAAVANQGAKVDQTIAALPDMQARAPECIRTRVPGHRYAYTLGDSTGAAKPSKISPLEIVHLLINAPDWAGRLHYDDFRRKPLIVDPPVRMPDAEADLGVSDNDVNCVRMYFYHLGFAVSTDEIRGALISVCRKSSFHPVRDYLRDLPVESPRFLDGLASKIFGTTDAIYDEMLKKFLVAAVRRVLFPGTPVHSMLVLHGGQGVGKSTFVRTLFPWYRENLPGDLKNKDACDALRGVWAIEVGEFEAVLRNGAAVVKDFISRGTDSYRPSFERSTIEAPRQCVFIGTTNDDDFLRDATGDRRYWPVAIPGKVDTEFVREYKDRIWSAAYALAQDETFLHYFTDDSVLNDVRAPFIEIDSWHERIEQYLIGKPIIASTTDVYLQAIAGGDTSKLATMGQREKNRVGSVLRRLGCKLRPRWVDGQTQKIWQVPERLSKRPPTTAVGGLPEDLFSLQRPPRATS